MRVEFSEYFHKTKGKPIVYAGKVLVMYDAFPVGKGTTRLKYRILSTDSEWKQGIAVSTRGVLTFEGNQVIKRGWADIWEHLMDWEGEFTCHSKDGVLDVKNVWNEGRGGVESWTNGAAMWIEEIPGGRRYHCNDGHFDDDLNDIVFEITLVAPEE